MKAINITIFLRILINTSKFNDIRTIYFNGTTHINSRFLRNILTPFYTGTRLRKFKNDHTQLVTILELRGGNPLPHRDPLVY